MDYDLIIIGGTPEAIAAAEYATALGARVALILAADYLNDSGLKLIYYQLEYSIFSPQNSLESCELLAEYFFLFREQILPHLAFLGVDLIFGRPQFCSSPPLSLKVNDRQLRSPSYLLATSSVAAQPRIDGIDRVNYLIPFELACQHNLDALSLKLAGDILIIGDSIPAIQLAGALNKLGQKITLIAPKKQILPYEDPDTSFLIQADLEGRGIEILTDTTVSQIKIIDGQKWVQAGNRAMAAAEIIVATSLKQPNINGLNLESVGVRAERGRIEVNAKLQTERPQIYACGDLIGGYNLASIGRHEAQIAVRNALFFPHLEVNYNYLSYGILTEPELGRVGLTETQARKLYGDAIEVVSSNPAELHRARIPEKTAGLCKLIILNQSTIVGCHLAGRHSSELIGVVAELIRNKTKLSPLALPILNSPGGTCGEIVGHALQKWQRDRLKKNQYLLGLLETFLIWRRDFLNYSTKG